MEFILFATCVLVAAFIGGTAAWWLKGHALAPEITTLRALASERGGAARELAGVREDLARTQAKFEAAQPDLEELKSARKQIFDLSREKASLLTKRVADAVAHLAQVTELTAIREEMKEKFKILAGDVLRESSSDFAIRADSLLRPLQTALCNYEQHIKEIEAARNESYGKLDQAILSVIAQASEVRNATASLATALKASPKTRGRWAEETLRRVMEMSQMLEHCDFETEKTFRTVDETIRPDVIISLAGGRTIIVDAKASTTAYLEAVEAPDDTQKELLLRRHAAQLRERLTNLSKKSYWENVAGSADCVVMFVPGDNFVAAAFEHDPNLFQDGIKNRVLICTPTTFIALAKAISYGWQQERLAANAMEINRLGKELYARLSTFGDHVSDLGRHINNSAKKYNALVGSLESNVMAQARRFNELGVEGTTKPLERLLEVDTVVRLPQPGGNLIVANLPNIGQTCQLDI